MITVTEMRAIADVLSVAPAVVDHDYVLGCLLHYLSLQPEVQRNLIFKGGTSLRKCHFVEYRFSEDLDFTATTGLAAATIQRMMNKAKELMQESIGIRTDSQETVVETIADDYGKESYEAKLYYEGPWRYGGTPRSLRMHINRDEQLLFSTKILPLIHTYSDQKDLPETSLRVYALEEIFVEKLRAFSGQRKWAVARDVYDLYTLSKSGVDINSALTAFPQKCAAKDISLADIDVAKVAQRRLEYENNWRNNLEYLVPASMRASFEEAWDKSLQLLLQALEKFSFSASF
jgi:predicted nucleotidyltransferase component of viral defense system